MKSSKNNIIGNGHRHHVALGKTTKVKAGPSFKHPGKKNLSKDMYANRRAESRT